jgi:hypothetical protein
MPTKPTDKYDFNKNGVWQESIGRNDPAPSYIEIRLSTGRAFRVCQEDIINCMEKGLIEATPACPSQYALGDPFNLGRKLSAADQRFLQAVGIEVDKT